MTNFELVEGVRSRIDVSYEEAKAALEQSGWDILAAVTLLEKQGKTMKNASGTAQAAQTMQNSETESEEENQNADDWSKCDDCEGSSCDECGENAKAEEKTEDKSGIKFTDILKRVCKEMFVVKKGANTFVKAPAVILPLMLVFIFWPTVIALLAGWLFGLEYGFSGPSLDKTPIDSAMGKVNKFFDGIRKDIFKTK